MKTTFFTSRFLKTLLMGVLVIATVSCSKTTEKIGNGLLPEGDVLDVLFTDTILMTCHSETIDSMPSSNMASVLFGSMVDPVMGRTDANLFIQLHLSSTHQRFGANPVVDSVVLQLGITGWFGDTTTLQTAHVFLLSDSLSSSESYYQFSNVNTEPTDLANGYQFRPHPKSSMTLLGNDTLRQAVIRIPLATSFGEYLISADTSVFNSHVNFKNFMYGLKIACESVSQDGAICYINPTSNTVTQLQLYYRETPEATNQMRYFFYITSEDVYFNQYLHDYTLGAPEFVQQVVQGDTSLGQQTLYLQSMGGVRTVIKFPNIKQWSDNLPEHEHLIINEAKLIIPASVSMGDSSVYSPISSLALLSINENGSTSVLQDYFEGSAYYGGSYSSATKNVVFRISEYLQQVILGKEPSKGLYLSITGASYNALRWIVAGPESNEEKQMKCEIKYSILSE